MDEKKLDRLIKLAKLANHNPNDGEANSAARALSKMLSEDNYKWIESAKRNGGTPPKSSSSAEAYYEWYDPLTSTFHIHVSKIEVDANPKLKALLNQIKHEIGKRPRTWNDVHRSEEPFWRRTRSNPFDDGWGESTGFDWEEEFRRGRQERAKKAREEYDETRRRAEREYKERQAQNWTWTGSAKTDSSSQKGYKKVYQQKCRDCSVCKITRLTVDDTNPYVCYECKRRT